MKKFFITMLIGIFLVPSIGFGFLDNPTPKMISEHQKHLQRSASADGTWFGNTFLYEDWPSQDGMFNSTREECYRESVAPVTISESRYVESVPVYVAPAPVYVAPPPPMNAPPSPPVHPGFQPAP